MNNEKILICVTTDESTAYYTISTMLLPLLVAGNVYTSDDGHSHKIKYVIFDSKGSDIHLVCSRC